MKHKYSFLLAVALTFSTLVFVSCRSVTVRRSSGHKHGRVQGPPPHAPAHGYRHKQHGVELVYDSGRGVYVVVELPNHFYFKGHYYRQRETQWEIGVHVDGPWEVVVEESLPKGLRGKKGKGKPKEHPGKGLGLGKKNK